MISIFKKKKSRRTPMTREVYLMERDPSFFRWLIAFFLPVREIKIGVAKNVKERHAGVDDGIPGNVIFLESYTIEAATTTESHLHKTYKKQRFTIRGAKRGSGKTEFFKFTNEQIQDVRRLLRKRSKKRSDFKKIFFFTCFILLIFYYLKFNS